MNEILEKKTKAKNKIDQITNLMKELKLTGIVIVEDSENSIFTIEKIGFSNLGVIGAAEYLKKTALNEMINRTKTFEGKKDNGL